MARTNKPACPCCAFSVDDLFLPPSLSIQPSQQQQCENEEEATEETTLALVTTPLEALNLLQSWLLVDTHCHAHLQREPDPLYWKQSATSLMPLVETTAEPVVVSLTCGVAPSDWNACLEYAARQEHRRPALGVHPWYLEELLDDQYQLQFTWLSDLEQLLQEHPGCMVGEIGLCKMARFLRTYSGGKQQALQMQRTVLREQLQLAARYQRPVSIHCVNQQGVLLELLQSIVANNDDDNYNPLPPTIALHSFSGTAHHVRQLLQWETFLPPSNSRSSNSPLFYFGFSHSINYVMSTSDKARRQGRLAIQEVPLDRLLSESDVHHENTVAAGTAGAVAYLASARGMELEAMAQIVRDNGLRFLSSLL